MKDHSRLLLTRRFSLAQKMSQSLLMGKSFLQRQQHRWSLSTQPRIVQMLLEALFFRKASVLWRALPTHVIHFLTHYSYHRSCQRAYTLLGLLSHTSHTIADNSTCGL